MWINYNGIFFPENALPISARDCALRYGVSLFETLRWTGGRAPLLPLHLRRLKTGMALLDAPLPPFWNEDFLQKEIQNTVKHNGIVGDARVRLQVSPEFPEKEPKNSGVPSYIIVCSPCDPLIFNALGIKIGLASRHLQPIPPPFCAYKTGNYLPYFLAAREAQARGLEDVLLLNRQKRIGEAAAANVFWTQDGQLFTPPLSEEIVAGVARKHLLDVLSQSGRVIQEQPLTPTCLRRADALFLTNAFRGLRWVADCEGMKFEKGPAEYLFKKAFSLLT